MTSSPSLVIADDHPMMLDGLSVLFADSGFDLLARARDGLEARSAIALYQPDLAVLDVSMPGATGLELLREARANNWATRIVLLTAGIERETIAEALRLRADGFVLKDAAGDVLLRCAYEALAGRPWYDRTIMDQVMRDIASEPSQTPEWTAREKEVAELVADGLRNKEIGLALGIGEGTVKMHLHNLYDKLGLANRTELAIRVRHDLRSFFPAKN